MPTTYHDTLEYVDAGGTTREKALNLTNLSANGPAVRCLFTPASHAPGTFEIQWSEPPETGIAIPFKSRCKVYAGRASTDGGATFSGGTIIFQGRRTDNHGSASGSQVFTSLILSDAWWDLMKVTYQIGWQYISGGTTNAPTFSSVDFPDLVLFQADPDITYNPAAVSNTISTWQQLQDIIRYAAVYASSTDAVQIQLAGTGTLTGDTWSAGTAEFTPCYLPWYPLRCGKCAEAIEVCLRPHPAVFTEMDYSTTPPTLHFRNRANMTAIDLPYKSTDANGVVHIASDIKPLDELVPDAVRIYYKINGTVNGQSCISYSNDHYPNSTNKLLCLDFPVDITGSSIQRTICDFESAAFDPTSRTEWRKRVRTLMQISEGGQLPNDGATGELAFVDSSAYNSSTHPKGIRVIGDDGTDYSSSYGTALPYITEGDLYTWMNPPSGTLSAVRATVKAFFTYHKVSSIGGTDIRDKLKEHEHTFRVILTNLPTGRYTMTQTLAAGETIPTGLAEAIWTELQTLQWKLRHEIFQVASSAATAVPTLIKPGKHKINLVGGHTDWETMNAVPEQVSIELFRTGNNRLAAKTSISCGPVNHLEPGYLIQLHNLFINRTRAQIDPNQRVGGVSGSTVDLSADGATENSVPAVSVPSVRTHVSADGVTRVFTDAENGVTAII
jgi:hypothetical protein